MGMNDFQIGLTAKLDDAKSKQQLNADIDDLKKQLNSVEVQAKLGKDVVSNITKQLNATQISLQNVSIDKATINKMMSQINNALSDININLSNNINGNSAIQSAQKTGQEIGRQVQRGVQSVTRNIKIDDIKASVDVNGNITTQIETMRNSFEKLGVSTNEVKNKMSILDTEVTNLRKLLNSGASDNKIIAQSEKVNTALKQTRNDLKQTRSEYSLLVSEQRRLSMSNTMEAWVQKNSSATESAKSKINSYIASLRDLNTQMSNMEFGKIQTGYKQVENSMRGLGKLGANLKDQISQATESFTQWVSISSVIMGTIYKVKQAVDEIKGVDDIITEISKTSDMTSTQLQKLTSSSFGKASNLGRTATDYLSGVEEMARSGYYGDQGEAMAQQSLLAQAAGDMTAELANKYVLATNAAYKFQGDAEKLNEVLDGQNMVSNRNSVAMEDMAEGMSKAGTVASSYRVSIEDLTAMIGTMEAVTKSGGDEVGNALKSILINLQNVSSDKITKTLDKANASMTEVVNGTEQLRKPMDILRDLAKTFNELDESDPLRAEILTNVGGKYQVSKLAALLQNVDMMDKMLKDYSEGSGSAMEEAEKSATNLSGRLNTLSNTWTSTVNNIVNSDELKTAVSWLNNILEVINNITDALDSVGSISTLAGLIQSLTGRGAVQYDSKNDTWGGFGIDIAKSIKDKVTGNLDISDDIKKNLETLKDLQGTTGAATDLKDLFSDADEDFSKFLDDVDMSGDVFKQYQAHMKKNQESTSLFSRGLKGAGTALKTLGATLGSMAAAWAIGEVISLAIKGFDNLAHEAEYAKNSLDEFNTSVKEQQSDLSSQDDWIKEHGEKYQELAKGVDEYGHNISLTSDEFSEYKNLTSQIADMFPNMIKGYNDQNVAILKNKGSIEELTKSYQENQDAYYANIRAKSGENFSDFKKDTKDTVNKKNTIEGLLNGKLSSKSVYSGTIGGNAKFIQVNGGNKISVADIQKALGKDLLNESRTFVTLVMR